MTPPSGASAGAASVVLLVALLVVGACARAASPDAVRSVAGPSVGAIRSLPTLIVALQLERSVASAEVLGMDGPLEPMPADGTEARRTTDAAVADFRAALAEGDEIASAYRPAVEALRQLHELRSDIDAHEARAT